MLPEISPYVTPVNSRPTNPGVMNAPVFSSFGPKKTVDQVKGLDGANNYPLGPDSAIKPLYSLTRSRSMNCPNP